MIVVIVLLLAALAVVAIALWRALERRDNTPDPTDRGVLAVDLRDRDSDAP
jgi:hypothetical protein